jgi:hypothetical protein
MQTSIEPCKQLELFLSLAISILSILPDEESRPWWSRNSTTCIISESGQGAEERDQDN